MKLKESLTKLIIWGTSGQIPHLRHQRFVLLRQLRVALFDVASLLLLLRHGLGVRLLHLSEDVTFATPWLGIWLWLRRRLGLALALAASFATLHLCDENFKH